MNDEEYQVRRIPENFGGGINILGMHFHALFLVEGVIFAAIIAFICLFVLRFLGIGITPTVIGFGLIFIGFAFFVGVRGINDEPITTFIGHIIAFNKAKRVAYYNPRVKLEAKSIFEEDKNTNKNMLPREKILAFFKKTKTKFAQKQQQKTEVLEGGSRYNKNNLFFEDDKGVIKTPAAYLTRSEEKEMNKLLKKKKAEMKKLQKEAKKHKKRGD